MTEKLRDIFWLYGRFAIDDWRALNDPKSNDQ